MERPANRIINGFSLASLLLIFNWADRRQFDFVLNETLNLAVAPGASESLGLELTV